MHSVQGHVAPSFGPVYCNEPACVLYTIYKTDMEPASLTEQMKKPHRYKNLSMWLKEEFGEPVRKLTLDAGLGCPNRDGTISYNGCIYCNERGSGIGQAAMGLSISKQIDLGLARIRSRYREKKFIAYFQSFTNTYAPLPTLQRLFKEPLNRDEIVGAAIGTRPDCVSDPVFEMISEISKKKLVWLELGVQSIHEQSLIFINRGHGPDAFFKAMESANRFRIPIVAHLMLGLPGESLHDMISTAKAVAAAGVMGVKLHPLYIVRGTAMEALYREGIYNPMSEDEAVEATLAILEVLPQHIVIHRLTSDPHLKELISPKWMLDKRGVRERLNAAMDSADLRQGSRANE